MRNLKTYAEEKAAMEKMAERAAETARIDELARKSKYIEDILAYVTSRDVAEEFAGEFLNNTDDGRTLIDYIDKCDLYSSKKMITSNLSYYLNTDKVVKSNDDLYWYISDSLSMLKESGAMWFLRWFDELEPYASADLVSEWVEAYILIMWQIKTAA